jgi:hypothetical protein
MDEQQYMKSVIQSFNVFSAFGSVRAHKESFGVSKMWVR